VFEKLLESLREVVDGERALADLAAIARFHRIQASPGYDEAAAWLTGTLATAGLATDVVEAPADGRTRFGGFPMPEGWRCRHARAWLHGAHGREPLADFDRSPLSIVQRSDRARGRFPLVVVDALDQLDRTDVRGKVVLTSAHAQRAHERAVVRRGAAGLACDGRRLLPPLRTEADDRDSLAYTSFWWLADRPRGWGVVASPARGQELRARLAAGEPLEIEVDFDCERFEGRIPLVCAVIPGSLAGEILITAHLCHPQPGAVDNASGAAAALECARALASLAAGGGLPEPRRAVRFLWMPEFTGTYAWQALRREPAGAAIAALNLDMVGSRAEDCGGALLLERSPHLLGSFADELLARILPAAREDRAGAASPLAVEPAAYSGGSDHAAWLDPSAGVPCPMLIQWPHRFYHSDLDSPERCDAGSLALAVRAAATYAGFLARAGAEEVDWLARQVGRGTERRLLAAAARDDRWEAAHAELERGYRALASTARLAAGLPGDHPLPRSLAPSLQEASEKLDAFFTDEVRGTLGTPPPEPAGNDTRVPARAITGLLCPMRWLAPGWDALAEPDQERLLALEAWRPGGSAAFDVAWFACDGSRDVGSIAGIVRREGWPLPPARLGEWFELVVALGLCRWHEPGSAPAS
jgi:hypothetical protein